jgi:hypothetical protein
MGRRSRCQNRLHRAWKPLGEWLLRELQREAPRRTAQRRDLLQPGRGEDRHRELAPVLQHQAPALIAGLSAPGSGGHLVAGFATRSRFAGHASRSAKTGHAPRLKPDHPMGAGHLGDVQLRGGFYPEFGPVPPADPGADAAARQLGDLGTAVTTLGGLALFALAWASGRPGGRGRAMSKCSRCFSLGWRSTRSSSAACPPPPTGIRRGSSGSSPRWSCSWSPAPVRRRSGHALPNRSLRAISSPRRMRRYTVVPEGVLR